MGIPGGLGSALLGSLVSAMLYGMTTLQTYVYYMHYSEDASTTKFIVAATWVLDTLQVSFMCHIVYYYLITNWGFPTSVDYILWSSLALTLVNSFVATIVQFFFAHQIYYLCPRQVRWLVTASIVLLVLARFGFNIGTVVIGLVNNEASSFSYIRVYVAIPGQVTAALCEVLITASLCALFYDSGSSPAFLRTKRLLNTLIVYAVNRCLLTLCVVIGELAATVDNQDGWLLGLNFICGNLYANSLLASLNTRQYLRSLASGSESDELTNAFHFANLPKLSGVVESSKDRVIDISAVLTLDKTTMLRREGGV